MIFYAVRFEDGTYKTQFKRCGLYGKTRSLKDAKLYASETSARENTLDYEKYDVVKIDIHEAIR